MRLTVITAISLALACSLGCAQGAAAKDPYRITYIMGLTGNPFYATVACGGGDQAKKMGVTFEAQGPAQYQPALQMRVLDAVIASKPDGIMFTADDPVALTPTLLQAKAMGIKIISIDGDLKDMSVAIANIQSDNILGGKQAAIALAKAIGDKGKVLAMENSPAASVSQQRLAGFVDEIKLHKDIEYLGVQYSNNQTAKAAGIVTATIAAHPDLAGIFTITTNNTEGAATGVREAGMVGKIRIVGFDTSDPIVEAIRQGIVTADVVNIPITWANSAWR
jgi:ribose transport system substrate-binding protein